MNHKHIIADLINMNAHLPSTAKDVLPTDHLGIRCAEREISTADLDTAIMHGVRTEGEVHTGQRAWWFTHVGITYITDYHITKGITSWANQC